MTMAEENKTDSKRKKVLVSGCFDLFHSGHVRFFEEASQHGDVYVCLGTDANIEMLKHHKTTFPEQERLYMIQSIKYVHHVRLSSGTGDIDFEPDMDEIKPDIFFVNEDGDRPAKRAVVAKRGIEFVVAKRTPSQGLKARSSTQLKLDLEQQKQQQQQQDKASAEKSDTKNDAKALEQFKNDTVSELKEIRYEVAALESAPKAVKVVDANSAAVSNSERFPWRLCLAGGWLDQPWVSQVVRGGVIVMNVHFDAHFKDRSGLATSTRNTALRLWPSGKVPRTLSSLEAAKLLFGAENPPDSQYVSGSQDQLGLFLAGINRLDYKGTYWPYHIVKLEDEAMQRGKRVADIYKFVQDVLWLIPMKGRCDDYDPLVEKCVTEPNVEKLVDASDKVWKALLNCDAALFGEGLTETLKAWKLILPNTVPKELDPIWQKYDAECHGCLFSGCGGGFLMVVSEKQPADNAFKIGINTNAWWHQ